MNNILIKFNDFFTIKVQKLQLIGYMYLFPLLGFIDFLFVVYINTEDKTNG